MNLVGRVFMPPAACPFEALERALDEFAGEARVVLVDFHAEATSEKIALGRCFDGRVSAMLGTHTHVQTADETVLPGGTAYISDLGMCGPHDSVLGREVEPVIRRFRTSLPERFPVARGDVILCGAVIDIDETTGRARSIRRLRIPLEAAS